MISFGHAAFVGAGAYSASICIARACLPAPWLGGRRRSPPRRSRRGLIGRVSLRTRGVYFIMITLAFAQMAFYLVNSMKAYGRRRRPDAAAARRAGAGLDLGNEVVFLLRRSFLSRHFAYGLHRSCSPAFGRVVVAIRENEREPRRSACRCTVTSCLLRHRRRGPPGSPGAAREPRQVRQPERAALGAVRAR